ncbi:DUF397 domain-containing protein [Streptomyces sp. NPDC051214]|uniref:DUF397 domain-containing protein n=1 Tax=Streptomyces sp. NPDC051214 TaxID=3155282 RepID=UPI003422B178
MEINQSPAKAQWRKSSYSGSGGGDCVECAPLKGAAWRKSTYSGGTGGECIEFAPHQGAIALRDSKNPEGPTLTVSEGAFARFVRAAAAADGGLTAP